ncbi:hypothetical protein LZ30DRAFT_737706 [Colletotrichum cereale]|nr:hypothetical protein LZ30DRAFT_737706 [Colletotrichum cereale]
MVALELGARSTFLKLVVVVVVVHRVTFSRDCRLPTKLPWGTRTGALESFPRRKQVSTGECGEGPNDEATRASHETR